MSMRRRELLKILGAGSLTLLDGGRPARAYQDAEPPVSPDTPAVLVDTVACIGCRKCELACNVENGLSTRTAAEFDDTSVLETSRRPSHDAFTVVNRFRGPESESRVWNIKLQCMHCVDPACASACLVGALRKDPRGPVTYDAWKCIGCRYCMIACPFQIPAYEYGKAVQPRVRKCVFCASRLAEGRTPACVAICPNEALSFGTRQEIIDAAHTRIQAGRGRYVDHVYGEHEGGGTSWVYLAPVDFALTGLPELDSEPIPRRTRTIQHGLFKSFVPPLALYGLLGLIMHSMRNGNGDTSVGRSDESR